jgi:hypothetical protein
MEDEYTRLKRAEEELYVEVKDLEERIRACMDAERAGDHPAKAHTLARLARLMESLP